MGQAKQQQQQQPGAAQAGPHGRRRLCGFLGADRRETNRGSGHLEDGIKGRGQA